MHDVLPTNENLVKFDHWVTSNHRCLLVVVFNEMMKCRNKKIVILSGVQIIDNPRVVKEANILANSGYDVEVIGAIFDATSNQRIQATLSNVSWIHLSLIDLSNNRLLPKIDYFFARLRRKFFLLMFRFLHIESHHQLGYFVNRLLRLAIQREADLYIIHMEQAMWVGRELIQQGYKVVTDIEDWYSENGLPEDRALRPQVLLAGYEAYLLKHSIFTVTTSKSMSSALTNVYRCYSPTVIYNSFPLSERKMMDKKMIDRRDASIPSIIWFSQTLGPGRGLEELISALNDILFPFELHLIATDSRGFSRELFGQASERTRAQIFVHPQVPQDELLSRINEHDIGFCGEVSDCRNSDLTVSNKMMEYLRGGLAIIASDTAGHQEVKQLLPNVISIYKQGNRKSLISCIKFLFLDKERLTSIKKESERSVQDTKLSYEYSEKVLVGLIDSYFMQGW